MLMINTNTAEYEVQWHPNNFFAEIYKSIDCAPGEYGWEYFASMPVGEETTEDDIQQYVEYRETELTN